ncbi:ammonium transporter [Mucilaginibacter sp. UYCu711]|uniref:ammonium transporter n=1 Tax=Mucilaginibacter sp. UYCu711 TaxID=3156339 RepID=UPI003D22B933
MIFKTLLKKPSTYLYLGIALIMLCSVCQPLNALAQDATGAKTGTINDVTAAKAGAPTLTEVAEAAGHNKIAINIVWTLIAGFLVMFMQAGFALVETGFTQKKNVAHTIGMNFMVYAVGMFGFWLCGFAFMFGGALNAGTLGGAPGVIPHEYVVHMFGHDFGLVGYVGFFLNSKVYDVGVFTLFLFQMVFMDTTATIPTGSMAERWSFKSFLLFGFFISMFVYPIYGNWVWGGGWLSQLGANFGLGHGVVDFAGSSVVHLVGGVAALAGAIIIGPRIGKFNADGTPNTIPGHNIPMAMLGTFILALGWFGFNPGSTLAGGDFRLAIVAVNTMMAGTAGTLAVLVILYMQGKKPDPGMLANGMLAGLVAITAPCAFVNSIGSVIIGAIAGVLVVATIYIMDHKLKIDDPVGAFAVHGVNGAWGVIALGLFADGSYGDGWNGVKGTVTGLFYGDGSQLGAQCIGVVVCFVFVFVIMYAFFKISNKITPIRVSAEDEIQGLDMPEMGVMGYVD